MKDEATCRRPRVEAFLKRDESDAVLLKPIKNFQQIAGRAPEPVESPDDKRVARPQAVQALFQLRAVHGAAAHGFLVNFSAPGFLQLRKLRFGRLIYGRSRQSQENTAQRIRCAGTSMTQKLTDF